jgi:hypothetical protein
LKRRPLAVLVVRRAVAAGSWVVATRWFAVG